MVLSLFGWFRFFCQMWTRLTKHYNKQWLHGHKLSLLRAVGEYLIEVDSYQWLKHAGYQRISIPITKWDVIYPSQPNVSTISDNMIKNYFVHQFFCYSFVSLVFVFMRRVKTKMASVSFKMHKSLHIISQHTLCLLIKVWKDKNRPWALAWWIHWVKKTPKIWGLGHHIYLESSNFIRINSIWRSMTTWCQLTAQHMLLICTHYMVFNFNSF